MTKKEFKVANDARIQLIVKKYAKNSEGLDEVESTELTRLDELVGEYMKINHPRDLELLAEFEQRVEGFREKLRARGKKVNPC
jgi:hypothetical protein